MKIAVLGAGAWGTAFAISLADRLMDLVRDKPMATAGVAVAAGLMALRNPAVIAVIVRTILDALPAKGRKKS